MKVLRLFLVTLLFISSTAAASNPLYNLYQNLLPFQGKVGIVTGGSTGIGYATSLEIARQGGQVVFCARDKHPDWYNGTSAEKTINQDAQVILAGGSATFFKADITKPEQIAAFIAFTHEKFGHIDFAVNNAGIAGKNARLDIFDEKYLLTSDDAIFNNLYGGVHLVRAEAKYWMEHGDPTKTYSIVLLSSYNGIRGCQGCDLYSASKHGLIGIVRSSAQSFSQTTPRIRINGVAPGLINTFLTRNQVKPDPDAGEAIREDNPLWIEAKPQFEQGLITGRLGQPEEIAAAILFLSSDKASYVTGTVLSVDGGDSAK